MNREKLDQFFEGGILALILAILVFAPLAFGAVDETKFLVVQMLTVAVMLLWAIRIIVSPGLRFFWPPLCWAVLAFALYAITRYYTSDIEYVARLEMIQTLLYAFLFFAIVNNLTVKGAPQAIVFTLVFLAAGISCYALWQFMTHTNHVWNEITPYLGRATGTYISPNNFSCFLEMLLPLAVAYVLTGRMKPLTRILLGYAALALAAGLVVTFSRGGWVAAAVGLLALMAVLICQRKYRLPAIVLLVVFLGGGSLFVAKYLSHTLGYVVRVKTVENSNRLDLEFRAEMWTAAEAMWRDHYWFGVGPAHYDYRFRQYRPENVQERPDRAHNDYLNLLADWGTTGGIIVGGGMLLFAWGLIKTWKSVRPDNKEPGRGLSNRFAFFVGASAALFALAVHSVIDFNLHIPANALIGVTLLALLTAQLRGATGSYRLGGGVFSKLVVCVVLAGGMAYFSFQAYWLNQEATYLAWGSNPDLPLLNRASLLRQAFVAEPKNFETAYQIGELYRIQSFQGDTDYESLAQKAMDWYQQGMKLDAFDGYNYLCYGMCLDWVGHHDEAEPYLSRAEALDPNGYFTAANIGWHYMQTGDYAAAQSWLQRSLRLEGDVNPTAHSYWDIVESKLAQNASGQQLLLPGY
jgi:O-antigen ligase